MRPSWVEIDLARVRANVGAFKGLVGGSETWTVVKADGYGHGDVPVAEAAVDAGAQGLCVALVEEGVRIREAGVDAPILVLSEADPDDLAELVHCRLTPTVYSHSGLEALAGVGPVPTGIALKVDTGMHRVGGSPDLVTELAVRTGDLGMTVSSVWTHFAVAEEDDPFTSEQVARLRRSVEMIHRRGVGGFAVHLSNTAGAMLHPDARGDAVRVGLGTYGLYPSPACRGVLALQPAMRVVSHVTHIARHPQGTRPSYGRRRPLESESTVVTVPIGYADGVPRLLGTRNGEVLIRGRRHPLAGAVTMDQLVVDVGDADVARGDEVVLIGVQGDAEVTADEWAEKTDTISYEIVSRIGPRLPRRYLDEEGGRQ